MSTILFVCQANVGRSQMAEAFYNFHTDTKNASSAGVEDFRGKYHHRPTQEIITTMLEKEIDIKAQRIDFLTPQMCDQAKKIVVLCAKELCPAFLQENLKVLFREIADPHQQEPKKIERIRDEIEQLVLEIIAATDG